MGPSEFLEGVRLAMHSVYGALDGVISPRVFALLARCGIQPVLSPATAALPFVASPTPVVLCCTVYLAVVALGVLAIRSSNAAPLARDPFPLRTLVILHNCFLFVLSAFMGGGLIAEAVRNRYSLWHNRYEPSQLAMARLLYLFFISKIYEFGDTFIMLLKRNTRQVSILHVYHHCSVALIWWLIVYHAPGGEAYFSAALNSWVHVAMYLYYLLSAAIGKDPVRRKKYLWWGRYLTMMQMTQFIINMIESRVVISGKDPPYPQFIANVLFYYMISLFALFANFYVQKYGSSRRSIAKLKSL
eukprot:TRINITY_DN15084_c0_g1_i1.p1 TRINITY_DN15084_c0_g1~~TRINITY_DN15084_c0_g1_i1.p1  ORF type:complete len:301 (+),score=25.55 TRINITY_DN15084_c0_g1_i1:146-1048(+)